MILNNVKKVVHQQLLKVSVQDWFYNYIHKLITVIVMVANKADVVEACAASGTREEEAARRLAVGGGGGVLGSRALCPFYQMDEIEFVNILRERYTRRAQMMQ